MTNTWVLLSLVSAFTLATSDALTKKALTNGNEYLVAWFRLLFSMPPLLFLLILLPVPEIGTGYYIAFASALPFEIIAMVLYIKALRLAPLSLTLPFLALTPVFLIFISYVLLEEKVSFKGGIGILLIAAGSYTLNIHKIRNGVMKPFGAIMKEKGSVFMIFVAFIYSITSSLGKMAIMHSSPLFFGATYFIMLTIAFTPVAVWMGRHELKTFVSGKQYRGLLLPGVFYSIMIASHMIAISLTEVAYMISLKRISLLIGVVYGYFLFKEKNIKERLFGALMMFTGFVLIVTAS